MRGLQSIHIKQIASSVGLNPDQVRELFPNHTALMLALVDEICLAHQEIVHQQNASASTAQERLTHFITSSLEFVESQPTLAEIIVLALLGTDFQVKERVFDDYARFFSGLQDDFYEAGIIPNKSMPLLTDLTEILLAVIFLGGCPKLQMDYLSFIDLEKVAVSTMKAIQQYMLYTENHLSGF